MKRIQFKKSIVGAAVLSACSQLAHAGCSTTGTVVSTHCASDYVQLMADTGTTTLTVDGVTTASVEVRPGVGVSGSFDQTLYLTGNTVINNPSYSGVIMQTDEANRNATVIAGSGVSITTNGGFGGIWVRNDTSGNVVINSAATVHAAGSDGITGATNDGSVTVVNSGTVTSTTDRGLYADGGYTNSGSDDIVVSIVNSGTVNAYQAGARAINYYGLASINNSGTIHSTTRQALVAWSEDGPVSITNSGTATSGDDSALHAVSETGNVTVVNSGTLTAYDDPAVVASRAGYSGIIAAANTSGSISVTNTASGRITARDDYAINTATPSGNIDIVNAGQVTGLSGIGAAADAGAVTLDNSGRIVATDAAGKGVLVSTATSGSIANSGLIYGAANSIDVASGALLSGGINNRQGG
jgi:hypothetical protein